MNYQYQIEQSVKLYTSAKNNSNIEEQENENNLFNNQKNREQTSFYNNQNIINGGKISKTVTKSGFTTSEIMKFLQHLEFERGFKDFIYLDSGGFGIIYKAIDKQGQEIAIKISKFNDDEISNELKIRKEFFDFKHITKVFDKFQVNVNELKFEVLIMECCISNLRHEIIRNKDGLTEEFIGTITFQLFNGIQEMHSNDIIHSDLKPDNILLDKNQQIKITDFGISIDLKTDKMLLGETKKYCSPEIGQKNFIPTNKIDIFSLGITMLEMIGGNINNIINGKNKYIGEQIKENISIELQHFGINEKFRNIFTIIKYQMLNKEPLLRKSAIQLKSILINYFDMKNIDLKSEINSTQQLIQEKNDFLNTINNKETYLKNYDYLRYLYCSLALLRVDPIKNLQISIDKIESSTIEITDQIFFKNQFVVALLDKEKFIDAEKQILNILDQINSINDFQNNQIENNRQKLQNSKKNKLLKDLLIAQSKEIYSDFYVKRQAEGDFQNAQILLIEVLEIKKGIYKDNHPEIVQVYHKLVTISRLLNQTDKQQYYLKKYLKKFEQLYSGKNIYVAQKLNAFFYHSLMDRQLVEAYEYGVKALQMMEDLKIENLLKAGCLNNFACYYTLMKKKKKAYEFREKQLELRIKLYGENHREAAFGYYSCSYSFHQFQDYTKSLEFYEKAFIVLVQNPRYHLNDFKYIQELYDMVIKESSLGACKRSFGITLDLLKTYFTQKNQQQSIWKFKPSIKSKRKVKNTNKKEICQRKSI